MEPQHLMRKIKRWQSRHLTDRRGWGTRSDTSQAWSWPRVNLSAAGSLVDGGTGGGGGLKAAAFTEHFISSQHNCSSVWQPHIRPGDDDTSSADLMGLL